MASCLVALAFLWIAMFVADSAFASSGKAAVGQTVTFSVTVNGTAPFTYQWYKDGAAVGGASNATYTIAAVRTTDAGTYDVVVSNSAGSTTSDNAVLDVAGTAAVPAITAQPASVSVLLGKSASLSVTASGTAPLAYQWRKGGANITGATSATYTVGSAQTSDTGTYSVAVSNSAGSVISGNATLTVTAAAIAPAITTQPSSSSVTAGTSVSFTVTASGTAPLSFQWRKGGVNLAGANSATYTIGGVQTADAGNYSVVVSNGTGSVVSGEATLVVDAGVAARPAPTAQLINLSSRAPVGTGTNLTIAGFVVRGAEAKTLLIRGIGPTLANYGVTGALPSPTMTVFSGDTIVGTNDGWTRTDADRIRATAQRVGAFALPEDGRDCAVLMDCTEGIYTVLLQDKNGGTGVGLIELYVANATGASRLVNLSTRAFVGRDSTILISGLVVAGPGSATLLLRAVGPGLTALGLEGVLSHPKLVLLSGSQPVADNTGWTTAANSAAIASVAAKVGAFPLDAGNADSAILVTVAPGVYTIQVSGANGETGIALVEIYQTPAN